MTDAEKYLRAQNPMTNTTFNIVPDKNALVEDYGQTLFLFRDGTMITGNREYTAFRTHDLSENVSNAEFYRTKENSIGFKYKTKDKVYNINFKDVNLNNSTLKQVANDTDLPIEGLKEIRAAELSFKENLKNIVQRLSGETMKRFRNK